MGELDIALRHLAGQHSEALAATYVEFEEVVAVGGWSESQLTWSERRLDKALELSVGGRRHLLHLEFQAGWSLDLPWRVFEYHTMLALAHVEAGHRGPPAIHSVVVLLSGPAELAAGPHSYGIGWGGRPFNGVHFHVDRIDRCTVAELASRPGAFWLALTPLTLDASATTLAPVLEHLQRDVTDTRHLADLVATMEILAERSPRQHDIIHLIENAFSQEIIMQSSLYQRAHQSGVEHGFEPLSHLYHRRLGRPLTDEERKTLRGRLDTHGADRITDVALDLGADELAAWLADADAV